MTTAFDLTLDEAPLCPFFAGCGNDADHTGKLPTIQIQQPEFGPLSKRVELPLCPTCRVEFAELILRQTGALAPVLEDTDPWGEGPDLDEEAGR